MTPPASPTTTPAAKLQRIHEEQLNIHAAFAKLDHALATGEISTAEYKYYIERVYNGKQEHDLLRELNEEEQRIQTNTATAKRRPRTRLPIVTALLVFVLVASLTTILLVSHTTSPLAGFVTNGPSAQYEHLFGIVLNESTNLALNTTNITGLRITGSLANGTGDVYLVVGAQQFLVYHGAVSSPAAGVSTLMASYALGESLDVAVVPASATSSLWLTPASGEKIPVDVGYTFSVPGAYELDALINDSGNISRVSTTFIVRNDTNTSNDVPASVVVPMLAFTDACTDTCALNATGDAPLSLAVQLSPGASLALTSITTAEPRTNHPPVQVVMIPNLSVEEGASVTLDLGQYFMDPDNDSLTYDFMNAPGVTMTVSGHTLTVTGVTPGVEQSVVYASDLYSITQSNQFTITVTPPTTTPENTTNTTTENTTNENTTTPAATNETNPSTTNETNETVSSAPASVAENQTNSTTSPALDCSNPDPNQRPLDCLNANATRFFEESIYWENVARVQVARITPIGNLLIIGKVIKDPAGEPAPGDFRISYTDENDQEVPTIWIDSSTGDLHLRGNLSEENANLIPPPGSYAVINRRGIYLAYADSTTGDLYVRGNVIPYRENINE